MTKQLFKSIQVFNNRNQCTIGGITIKNYKMSYTAAPILPSECISLASEYIKLGDWDLVKKSAIEQNLIQARALGSLKRIVHELIYRLKSLDKKELEWLIEANQQEQLYMLWLAICRSYRFIAEFSDEVLREQFITFNLVLNHEDYDLFFRHKADWHAELDELSDLTKQKVRQVLFKMLTEANLIDSNNMIQQANLSLELKQMILDRRPDELRFFPLFSD